MDTDYIHMLGFSNIQQWGKPTSPRHNVLVRSNKNSVVTQISKLTVHGR